MCLSISQNRDVDWVSAGTYNIIWLKKMLFSKPGFYCRTSENHDSCKALALKLIFMWHRILIMWYSLGMRIHHSQLLSYICYFTWNFIFCQMWGPINCFKKRSSSLQNSRMSGISYRIMASLSKPKPNAQPILSWAPAAIHKKDKNSRAKFTTWKITDEIFTFLLRRNKEKGKMANQKILKITAKWMT